MTPLYQRIARNTKGRDFIVGDVHGCFTGLRAALDAIGFDESTGDRLFMVGDLVDRGPESDEVLEWLAKPWVRAVRGNHEQMAIDHCDGYSDTGIYLENGGAWLLGMTRPERQLFADAFRALPIAIELETEAGLVGIVHAECPFPNFKRLEAELQSIRSEGVAMAAMWSRTRIECRYTDEIEDVRAVVVGHTPMTKSVTLGNHIYIDTMGWRRGEFTILDAATLKPARATTPA